MYLQSVKLQQRHLPECHAGKSSLLALGSEAGCCVLAGEGLVAFPGVGEQEGPTPGSSGSTPSLGEAQLQLQPALMFWEVAWVWGR